MAPAPTPPAFPDDPSCPAATASGAEALHKVWTSCLKNADVESLRRSIAENLKFRLGVAPVSASPRDVWMAVAYMVRDLMVEARFRSSSAGYRDKKWVGYLSMEFLIGRLLVTNLHNLGLVDAVNEALAPLCMTAESLGELEPEAGLGNGGLGRLAACFLDSMATMDIPAIGYGVRYEHGMFRQEIIHGEQVERLDNWMRFPSPWQIVQPDKSVRVEFFGKVVPGSGPESGYHPKWVDTRSVIGVPHDVLVAGFGGRTINILRLWAARATSDLDLDLFNAGDYVGAASEKARYESITKILYPNDASERGRELRLMQEAFFVTCSVADTLRRFHDVDTDLRRLPRRVALQMNDTHPALAVAELMRALLDQHAVGWETAFDLVKDTLGYTNHTLLPEALERWPVPMMERVLPRHMEIIRELDRRLGVVALDSPKLDAAAREAMSIVDQSPIPHVRMANLAVLGSHAVNGVSRLHSELIKERLFPGFAALHPDRFTNATNGVTPRLWILKANPGLAQLLDARVGRGWVTDLDLVEGLRADAADRRLQEDVRHVKDQAKRAACNFIYTETGLSIDPSMMFDVHVKRFHEYKRQLMVALGALVRWRRLKAGRTTAPHVTLFAGKAAPGYARAKLIIRFACRAADVMNADRATAATMKTVFLPNYNVATAERVIPAADLSEQVSTAGCEASGTGNMKFAMNGALTIGTMDGANIEIFERTGPDHMFVFGMTADDVERHRRERVRGADVLRTHPEILETLDFVASASFDPTGAFAPLRDAILGPDMWCVLADLPDWLDAQDRAESHRKDSAAWGASMIHNIAAGAGFSSDRTIATYAREIWRLGER